jgi:hypothetical protein
MSQAGITRAQIRYWERLWPALKRNVRGFSPAEAVALCALAQVVRDTQCNVKHLKPIAAAVFGELGDGDWQRFEHRRLLITLPGGTVQFAPKGEAFSSWPEQTLIAVDLAPHVHAVRLKALGLPAAPSATQLPLFEQRKRKRRASEPDHGRT